MALATIGLAPALRGYIDSVLADERAPSVVLAGPGGTALLAAITNVPVREYLAAACTSPWEARRVLRVALALGARAGRDRRRVAAAYALAALVALALELPGHAATYLRRALRADRRDPLARLLADDYDPRTPAARLRRALVCSGIRARVPGAAG